MSSTWNEKAGLSKDAYDVRGLKEIVTIHGVSYTVLDTVKSSPTGFQATAYQRIDTGDVEIIYRGTEAAGDWFRDDRVDFGMVRSKLNAQLPEAEVFTLRVIAEAKAQAQQYHHPIEVTVAGHSLGGTEAEIMAARHHLGGESFNAYGAVDLAYGVPEGQPRGAATFINHVKATDIVSAASRHYGEVRGYATEQDVEALRQGRYLDPADPAHPANPMITGSLSAHFISNFAPDPGEGPTLLTAENAARYQQYGAAFEHFRHDVLVSREVLHQALNGNHASAGAAYLHEQFDDAVGVAVYGHAVRSAEAFTGLDSFQARADRLGNTVDGAGRIVHAEADLAARGLGEGGQAVHARAEAASVALREAGKAWRDDSADVAGKLAPLDPIAGGALALGAEAAGMLGQYTADDLAAKARVAGRAVHGISEFASDGLRQTGEALQQGTQWMARQWHEAGQQAQDVADALAGTKAHDRLVDALRPVPRLDHPGHPDHPMFQQAWDKVQKIDAAHGREPDQRSRNFSGALVVSAKAAGLRRIDTVTLSDDGTRAFASEQVLGRTFQRHADVHIDKAVVTPLEQSSTQAAMLPSPTAPAPQAPEQTQGVSPAPISR